MIHSATTARSGSSGIDQQAILPFCKRSLAVLALLTAFACVTQSVNAQDDTPADVPSKEECRQVAEEFEELIQSGRSSRATRLVDWESIVASATDGFEETPQLTLARRGFKQGFVSRMRDSGGLTAQIVAALDAGGTYRLLRMHEVDGRPRALFRLLLPQGGGVNYHDLEFHRGPGGAVRISDLHIALSGERFSETLRRAFLPVAAEALGGQNITEANRQHVEHLDALTNMAEAARARDYAQALSIYAELPESLQQDTNVLLVRLQASQNASDEAYAEAIADFSRFHPDDLCVELLSIDGYLLRDQHEESLAAVDRLEKSIGGDPFLHVLRAGILYDAGRLDEAEQSARQAIKEEPGLENAYWQVISVSLDQADYKTTVEMLTLLEDRLGVEFVDLTEVPEYSEFVKSREFRDWNRERQ
ncbi:MAG: hypothetical protein DWQ34_27925 [Planctomycetota bacterium]|nr:MAG: hypothetical protein DWQ34_27925 [Planctomycetota bacterium]REK21385.1 MAG: hypothetical protein DWQ41_21365 [Planctomycetota bacterium]REK40104.1 MAG: hypothetical protein DWQ45_00680 [Planctomycetota bacterium]